MRPQPLKAASRGPLRPLRALEIVDTDNIKPFSEDDDLSITKSVTIAVQYAPSESNHSIPSSPMLIEDTSFSARAWRSNNGENSICCGLPNRNTATLVGTKCSAPGNRKSDFEHTSRCFENLVKIMESSHPRAILQQLRVLGNNTSNVAADLEYQLWISTLLQSRTLRKSNSVQAENNRVSSSGRLEILDLNGTIGTKISDKDSKLIPVI
jgi:hypothetical protein